MFVDKLLETNNKTIKDITEQRSILEKKISEINIKISKDIAEQTSISEKKFQLIMDKFYDYNIEFQVLNNISLNELYFDNKLFIIGTSEHSNIGDAAITMGEYEFIKNNFPRRKVIEISTYEFFDKINYITRIINNNDIIFLQGGGNLGNKFLNEEKVRRFVIDNFPNNKIVILPQTIYFSDDIGNSNELEISKKIYNKHKNLTIFTRGKTSLDFANKNFNNAQNHTMIDSALNLNYNFNYARNGILACIRDLDDESGLTKEDYDKIISIINKHDNNFHFTNNLHSSDISKMQRNAVVLNQLKLFAKHKLVITDRLHGLILSLMTNTPCIVISSYNYKLQEFLDILGKNKYVKFIDKDINILDKEIKKTIGLEISDYRNNFSNEFKKMAEIIKNDIHE